MSHYYQRDDDKEEVVRERLEGFKTDTQPMIDKLDGMGLLVKLNGDRKPEAITEELLLNMENYLKDSQPSMSKTLGILLALAVPLAWVRWVETRAAGRMAEVPDMSALIRAHMALRRKVQGIGIAAVFLTSVFGMLRLLAERVF